MLSAAERQKAVEILLAAEADKQQALQLSKTYPHIEIGGFLRHLEDGGGPQGRAGRQAGGPQDRPHLQGHAGLLADRRAGLRPLLDSMVLNDGAKVRFEDYCVPRVEPELTFILKEPLKGPGVGLVTCCAPRNGWCPPSRSSTPACRTRARSPTRWPTTAPRRHRAGRAPVRPTDVDLRWVGAVFYRNSEIEETGLAAGVLGHPAMAIAWLANKVGRFGTVLEPGHLMLSGSFTRPVFAAKATRCMRISARWAAVAVQFRVIPAMELPRNAFKHALAAGQTQIGLWCSLCSNITVDVVSDSGFDCCCWTPSTRPTNCRPSSPSFRRRAAARRRRSYGPPPMIPWRSSACWISALPACSFPMCSPWRKRALAVAATR